MNMSFYFGDEDGYSQTRSCPVLLPSLVVFILYMVLLSVLKP